jgi:hypothetical protein
MSAAGRWAAERAREFADMLRVAVAVRAEPGVATRAQLLDAVSFTETALAVVDATG